jgi:L-asparaginase II
MTNLVELSRIRRGEVVESVHRGVAVVADVNGAHRHEWGNAGLVTTPRSSLKPFQAVALVESGAADAFGLDSEHIALACASHAAQPFQVELATLWLERLELSESALVCGPALPRGTADIVEACRHGGGPRRIYNNCSGKHCGFLSMARHMGGGLGYAERDHPAQRLYLEVLSDFIGRDAAALPWGIDGCGLPALALTVGDMARAAARFASVQAGSEARRAAVRRVLDAMAAHPDHISGRDDPTSRIIRATGGRVVLKGGAEGFVLAFLRDQGLGVAIKVADGASRGKMGVLVRVLERLGAVDGATAEALMAQVEPPILDTNGNAVGRVEVSLGGDGQTFAFEAQSVR